MHFNWVQLCQDLPWLIKHVSSGNEANRKGEKKMIQNILYIVVQIYLSQRVIPAKQPDHKQHEETLEREERPQLDVAR